MGLRDAELFLSRGTASCRDQIYATATCDQCTYRLSPTHLWPICLNESDKSTIRRSRLSVFIWSKRHRCGFQIPIRSMATICERRLKICRQRCSSSISLVITARWTSSARCSGSILLDNSRMDSSQLFRWRSHFTVRTASDKSEMFDEFALYSEDI
jgi:hypothetical protein